jgi:hypothetical protein
MTSPTGRIVRRTLALLTAGVAGFALAGCSLLGNVPGTQTDEGTVTDVFAMKVGDCLNDASAGDEVSSVPIVPCSEPHDSEAYHAFDLPGDVHPGDEAVKQAAGEGCVPAFEKFVGIAYPESNLDFAFYFPTTGTWDQGDREILCIVYDPAGKVSGSLKGEAR